MQGVLDVLCGAILPLALLFTGGYFAAVLLPRMRLVKKKRGGGGRGSARALAVALSGTLGVGNIVGVATAIALGGAGAVLWMWISAGFAMLLKYAEVVLAMQTRRYDAKGKPHGGAYYYIKEAFEGRIGRVLSAAFALLCVLCALTLGGVIQSAAAAEALYAGFSVPRWLGGLLVGGGCALILSLGAAGVERACTAIIPVVCVAFVVVSLAALVLRAEAIPAAFAAIFEGGFSLQSGGAGVLGFLTSRAVRYGVSRGLVSNEAGCGTAPIAHASAEVDYPARQGLWGITEVFVDTVLLCTLTALVLLVSGVSPVGEGGMEYALAAYGAILGVGAVPFLSVCVCLFAFATVLCWAHYGAEALGYLRNGAPAPRAYPLGLALACLFGAVAAPALAWGLTDLVLALMALLNIATLFALRRQVIAQTRDFFQKEKRPEGRFSV